MSQQRHSDSPWGSLTRGPSGHLPEIPSETPVTKREMGKLIPVQSLPLQFISLAIVSSKPVAPLHRSTRQSTLSGMLSPYPSSQNRWTLPSSPDHASSCSARRFKKIPPRKPPQRLSLNAPRASPAVSLGQFCTIRVSLPSLLLHRHLPRLVWNNQPLGDDGYRDNPLADSIADD